MLLFLLISFLGLSKVDSASTTPSLHLMEETPHPQNVSSAAFSVPYNLDSSVTPASIDPRFTYDNKFAHQLIDRNSAYLNTLLALADLSSKGWTPTLRWEAQYTFSSYGDVTIRIHASQNPSTLQYRYAIWGLYFAIRETSANDFEACVLTLYWTPRGSESRQMLGYVSILGGSSLGINSSNSTEGSPDLALPTQTTSPELALARITAKLTNPSSITAGAPSTFDLETQITLLGKPLDMDSIFHIIYTAMIYLASWPQTHRIDKPGVAKDDMSRTFLRWDSSYLTVQPSFEYRYAIAALAKLPVYMYEQNKFEEARIILYIDKIEVGRGWLYRTGRSLKW